MSATNTQKPTKPVHTLLLAVNKSSSTTSAKSASIVQSNRMPLSGLTSLIDAPVGPHQEDSGHARRFVELVAAYLSRPS
jgi:hypothetical protein